MAAVLAWIAADRTAPLDEARWQGALARLAARGPAGCRVHRQPGFALAVLLAGTPSEQQAGAMPRLLHTPALVGALDGWLIEQEALARQLGLDRRENPDNAALWLAAHARQRSAGLAAARGHYAGLLYDSAAHELIVQRDPGGARALYARQEADGCWLASDEAALVSGGLDAALDVTALPRYFAAMAPLPGRGWFAGVRSINAGEQWCFDGRQARLSQRIELPQVKVEAGDAEAVEQWRVLLRQAVARTVAGVDGCPALSLSSGLDSQSVAAQLRLLDRPFAAHSWLLPAHPQSNEDAGIRALADAFGAPLHGFDGSSAGPLAAQWTRPVVAGELLANIYRELKHRLYGQVRSSGAMLLLNGDSGDHLYGDPGDWFIHSLQQRRLGEVWREAAWRLRQHGLGVRADPALRRLGARLLGRPPQFFAPADFTPAARDALCAGQLREFEDSRQRLLVGSYTTRAVASEHALSEPLGLEVRSPLRDPDLLGFARQMRPALSQRRGVRKWISREALRGQLPESCRNRQKSGDLGFFLRASLTGPILVRWRQLLEHPQARWSQFVEPASVRQTLADPQAASESRLVRAWLCVAFEHWRHACASGAQFPTMESSSATATP